MDPARAKKSKGRHQRRLRLWPRLRPGHRPRCSRSPPGEVLPGGEDPRAPEQMLARKCTSMGGWGGTEKEKGAMMMYGAGRDEARAQRCPGSGTVAWGGHSWTLWGCRRHWPKSRWGGGEGSGQAQGDLLQVPRLFPARRWLKGMVGRGMGGGRASRKRAVAVCCPSLGGSPARCQQQLPTVRHTAWRLPATLPGHPHTLPGCARTSP